MELWEAGLASSPLASLDLQSKLLLLSHSNCNVPMSIGVLGWEQASKVMGELGGRERVGIDEGVDNAIGVGSWDGDQLIRWGPIDGIVVVKGIGIDGTKLTMGGGGVEVKTSPGEGALSFLDFFLGEWRLPQGSLFPMAVRALPTSWSVPQIVMRRQLAVTVGETETLAPEILWTCFRPELVCPTTWPA